MHFLVMCHEKFARISGIVIAFARQPPERTHYGIGVTVVPHVGRSVDDQSAQVIFNDCGKSVSAYMFFDEAGRLTNFTAKRYREIGGEFSLDPWSTPITSYGKRAGLNLPVCGQAVWNLDAGDLVYAELEITEIKYNSGVP